ncbi:MAG: tRNA pseudouridine(38-40) synthase TruA [Clostridia bacterium]|nr:tRNA pseudouridine(38-40) synthase TruA [Clostridia bacterium]
MRVRLDLSYDGAAFCGFQVQKNAESVQGALCRALKTLTKCDVPVSGCSRTDAGVHARVFVCHTDLPWDTLPSTFLKSLNALLPDEIGVFGAIAVADDFHARYSAKQKTYRYYVVNSPARSPLSAGRALQVYKPLALEKMQEAAKKLVGKHDFAAFQAAGSKVRDTVRTVTKATLIKESDTRFYLEISADGFLYRMVRNIMGTLLDIGLGKDYDISEILASRDRERAGRCAPPEGLYLWQVDYE